MCTVTAIIGLICTLALKFNIDEEIAKERYLSAEWGSGYYLTIILFLAAAAVNIYLMTINKSSIKSPPLPVPRGGKFCPQCGTRNDANSDFCSECGIRISADSEGAAEAITPSYTPPIYDYEPDNYYQSSVGDVNPATPADDATQLLQMPVYPVLKIDRNGVEETITINKPEFVIGRNSDIVDYYEANNNNIGRIHAKIVSHNNSYFIIDLDSKNGTFLNGVRLNSGEPAPLAFKDKIRLANVEYTFDEV